MGFKKAILCAGGLMLATGGPITLFSASDMLGDVKRNWLPAWTTTEAATSQQPTSAAAPVGPSMPAASPDANIAASAMPAADATPMPSLAEVLRFDVTVEWVMRRWARVSTGLPHLQLQGYRVPLVTGTRVTDVAGSLTYYFNAGQQVQRITLHGTTGDPRVLLALLTDRHHFARRLTNDPGVVLFEAVDSDNQSLGTLKIRSAQVIKASQPHTRFEVDLTIERPGTTWGRTTSLFRRGTAS